MEIEFTSHQDITKSGYPASGIAGTGPDQGTRAGITGPAGNDFTHEDEGFRHADSEPENPKGPALSQKSGGPSRVRRKETLVVGLGVLASGKRQPAVHPEPVEDPRDNSPEPDRGPGDLIFSLYERQERIAERLNRKIDRLARRLEKVELRRRS